MQYEQRKRFKYSPLQSSDGQGCEWLGKPGCSAAELRPTERGAEFLQASRTSDPANGDGKLFSLLAPLTHRHSVSHA